ncbi:FtsX-like permease family protein [Microbacterium sp. Marseille-Q6648]|uniref:FtsX-like permease family protein n=1 Tax=Microbacterium sp. Marseille-Q6648 TaxID=2937991 RepID=UPI00203CC0E6|nr:FtsX-like permease family protein [Microbacterium sp. Marseille-Q6648]
MSHRLSVAAMLRRHLRAGLRGGVAVFALVLLVSSVAAATPAALSALGDAALDDRLAGLPATVRDVEATAPEPPQLDPAAVGADEVWAGFTTALERVREGADDPLPSLLDPARVIVRSDGTPLGEGRAPDLLSLAADPRFAEEITIAEGRLPAPLGGAVEAASGSSRLEVVLSTRAADELQWAVGEVRGVRVFVDAFDIELVGVFEPADPNGGYWQHVRSVLEPSVFDDGNAPRVVTATAFVHPAQAAMLDMFGRATTTTWYPLSTRALDSGNADTAAAALRGFTAAAQPLGDPADGPGIQTLRFEAPLATELETATAQQGATTAVLAMMIAGPAGVAAAVLLLACRLIVERRRAGIRLLSARGASHAQLRALLGAEGLMVGALPAVIGIGLVAAADALRGGTGLPPASVVAAGMPGLAVVLILAVLAPTAAERRTRTDVGRGAPRRRLIAEAVVVILTVVAVVLLFVRGPSSQLDPLIAATPLLLALTACLITLRLYPLPLGAILARARSRSGFVAFLGAARTLREPSIGVTPVLALVVGMSVAVSSGVLLSTLQTGIDEAAGARVGADARISGDTFTRDDLDRVHGIDGVAAATGLSGFEPVELRIDGERRPAFVIVVEGERLREVQGTIPGLLPEGVSVVPAGESVPVVIGGATAELVGDSADVRVGDVEVEVVGVSRGPNPVGARDNWIVLDESAAAEAAGRDPVDRTVLVRFDDAATPSDVVDRLTETLGDVRVDTIEDLREQARSGVAVAGMRSALLAATALAALLSAVAIALTIILASGARQRVVALLRTLGAPSRRVAPLLLWEIAPPAVAAVVGGTVFGLLIPVVVLAGVDLRPFTGSTVQPLFTADAATLAVTIGGFVAIALVSTAVAVIAGRRVGAASALRLVEEG